MPLSWGRRVSWGGRGTTHNPEMGCMVLKVRSGSGELPGLLSEVQTLSSFFLGWRTGTKLAWGKRGGRDGAGPQAIRSHCYTGVREHGALIEDIVLAA